MIRTLRLLTRGVNAVLVIQLGTSLLGQCTKWKFVVTFVLFT
jgi:hypothetical protein